MGRAAAAIERADIPTVSVVGSIFTGVCQNAMRGMGFSELPMAVVPQQVLTREIEDFKPAFTTIIDDILYGLTRWQTKATPRVIQPEPEMFTIEGESYQQAVDKMNRLFLQNNWSDGLPLTPPTEERVEWLLTGTDLPRGEVIATVPPKRGQASVEAIAISAAMAGARPEYMPVIIAAVKAMANPQFELDQLQGTTCNVAPLIVVNGPIAREIGINSGYGLMGPAPRFPAGATIGRALRLIMMILGGALPGSTSMAIHGQPGRYTGLVIAEAEDLSPWEPLSVERGYSRNSNTVTAVAISGTTNVLLHGGDIVKRLEGFSRVISYPTLNYFFTRIHRQGEPQNAGVLLLPPGGAKELAAIGWSKQKTKAFLFDKAKITVSDLLYIPRDTDVPAAFKDMSPETLVPLAHDPDSFLVVVAGGELNYHWLWLPAGHSGYVPITTEIELPANWAKLLAQAQS